MSPPGRFDVREKAGTFIAVFAVWLAVVLAAFFLVNVPRSERVKSLRETSEEYERKLAARSERVEELRADYERVMGGNRSLQTFYNDVLSTKRLRMTAVQREIREIARRFNIKPESIVYSRYVYPRDRIVKFSAVLPLTGSYESLRQFISALERSENFLVIESVALGDSKEGGVILQLNITVDTYFFDPDVKSKAGAPEATS